MKINKHRPWLPQETPPPIVYSPNLEKEFREAKKRADRAKRVFQALKKKCPKIDAAGRLASVEKIILIARYRQARKELLKANTLLLSLRQIKKRRVRSKREA